MLSSPFSWVAMKRILFLHIIIKCFMLIKVEMGIAQHVCLWERVAYWYSIIENPRLNFFPAAWWEFFAPLWEFPPPQRRGLQNKTFSFAIYARSHGETNSWRQEWVVSHHSIRLKRSICIDQYALYFWGVAVSNSLNSITHQTNNANAYRAQMPKFRILF